MVPVAYAHLQTAFLAMFLRPKLTKAYESDDLTHAHANKPMTEEERIQAAYAHMDETNAAYLRGEETTDEKKLRDARKGRPKKKGTSVPLPIRTGQPKKRGRPKGAAARAAASAWKLRNADYRRRRSLRIEDAGHAIEIWSTFKKEGEAKGSVRPRGVGRSSPVVGDSVERQVYDRVQLDNAILGPGERLADAVGKWLPCTFYSPVAPLCDAELDELAREDEALKKKREGDSRLLPGMARS